ncbi:MAG: WD40 repeat domain-containing protein [Candidatus Promineifilaceae bacterium]
MKFVPYLLLVLLFAAGCRQNGEDGAEIERTDAKPHLSYAGPHPADAQGRLGKGSINVTAYSPDGEYIIAGGDVGVYMYESESLEQMWQIPSAGHITSLAASPDGSLIAVGAEDGSVTILDASDGTIVIGTPGQSNNENSVFSLAWSEQAGADESLLLAAGFNDGNVVISQIQHDGLPVEDGLEISVFGNLDRQRSGVPAMAFSPNGRVLATGTRNGLISIWDTETLAWIGFLDGHELAHAVFSLDWSTDGRWLLSGGRDETVILWDMTTLSPQHVIDDHNAEIVSVDFSPDSKYFGSISADGTGYFWNLDDSELEQVDDVQLNALLGATWSPTWDTLAVASPNGQLATFNIDKQPSLNGPTNVILGHSTHGQRVSRAAWSPAGDRLASGLGNEVRIWDVESNLPTISIMGHDGLVGGLDWSPDGTQLATGDADGLALIWDTTTGDLLKTLDGHTSGITDLRWSPDGRWIATVGSLDDTVLVWDPASGEPTYHLSGLGSGIWSVEWSPDSGTVTGGTTNGEILFWNLDEVTNGELTRVIRRHLNWISGLSYSPDGRWLASSGADNRIVLTELETERAITYAGHSGAVRSVDFSPDGKVLASGSQDELVILWDVATPGENTVPLAVYTGHADGVDDVRWSPDGRLVASGSDDGTVLLWPGSPPTVVDP